MQCNTTLVRGRCCCCCLVPGARLVHSRTRLPFPVLWAGRFQEIVDLNAVNVAVSDTKSQQVRTWTSSSSQSPWAMVAPLRQPITMRRVAFQLPEAIQREDNAIDHDLGFDCPF